MTTSTIERVARAIAAAEGEDYMEGFELFDRRARAALKAIRIPDDDAVIAVEVWARSSKTNRTWADGFTVMVDAMLGGRD